MKFKIESTANWNNTEKLLAEYPCLKDFNFTVESTPTKSLSFVRDENGKKIFFEKPGTKDIPYVDIKDLDDLMKLHIAVGNPLIIGEGNETVIEIYDTYRE